MKSIYLFLIIFSFSGCNTRDNEYALEELILDCFYNQHLNEVQREEIEANLIELENVFIKNRVLKMNGL